MTYCETIAGQLGALFTCLPHDKYVRIRTPFLYPDGDIIDIFVREIGDTVLLTDLGESLRWLKGQTLTWRRSQKQKQLIDDVCLNHGVELYKGMLTVRVRPSEAIAPALIRVAQASLRVADIWFTLRTRTVQSITDEIADFFTEKEIKYDRGEKQLGRSGRTWNVDFHVFTPDRSSLVLALATGSKGAARGIAEHAVAAWHDLSHLHATQRLQFVSLFDDTADVWNGEDYTLVESLSVISRWSRPDEFEQVLRTAA